MLLTSALAGLFYSSLFFYFGWVSYRENEKRAAIRALSIGIVILLLFLANYYFTHKYQTEIFLTFISVPFITLIVFLIPTHKEINKIDENPNGQIDERDIMFSRKLLSPGTQLYDEYYADKPKQKKPDDIFRKLPGLLSEKSSMYEPFTFTMASAIFGAIDDMKDLVDGEINHIQEKKSPETFSLLLKNWLIKQGCVSSGIADIQDYHYYSYVGRGAEVGKPVILRHKFGIVFTVEMRKEMVDCAPHGPTVMESAQQYMNVSTLAIQLARMIRKMGYTARAHIDGNYRLICPLVARDVGLGDIGRMGLLMTPQLGPRVRIGVVTTDFPLLTDRRKVNPGMINFCDICKKCAQVCPSNAISFSGRYDINNVHRWQIDQEACYTLWCKLGTDCGRCMAVCPYSHPDTFLHNVIRQGINHSSLFARFALLMDNFFYGPKPSPKSAPEWMNRLQKIKKNMNMSSQGD